MPPGDSREGHWNDGWAKKEDRWRRVLKLVASGTWYGNATAVELAAEWGIEVDTVCRYRTEALRAVRVMADDELREEIREILASRCDRIYQEAMDKAFVLDAKGEEHPQADCKAAAAAVRLHASLYGLMTKRVDVHIGELADKYAAMSEDELQEEWRQLQSPEKTSNGHAGEVH